MGTAGVWSRIERELRFLRGLRRTLKRVSSITPDSPTLVCDDLEAAVDRFGERAALAFEGRVVSYSQFDAMANRYGNWARARGIKRGDVVALFMPNRLEYIAIWYGLSKVGVVTALVNYQLSGASLAHCLNISNAAHVICDAETAPLFEEARNLLARSATEWIVGGGLETGAVRGDRDLDQTLRGVSSLRPSRETARQGLTAKDVVLYIFTSGTTGLPKAARITHARAQLYMRAFAAATEARPDDRIYNALPLYHATGGLCGVGAGLLSGAVVLIKRRFSASQFWAEVVEDRATMFVYIGELCRYLVNQPERDTEHGHSIRLAFGNGLRAEVWERMLARFRIPRILEFYGATEGNVSLFNFDGRVGAVGRIPGYLRKRFNVRLVRTDVVSGEALRDGRGRCEPCDVGEIGEAIGEIAGDDVRKSYAGYADRAASERKVLHDVFAPGDAWFRTGDLMRQDREGYLYFVDRLGDTFRWRGENVSTGEVEAKLGLVPGVSEVSVYGVEVPGAEGKAGMAALSVESSFDLHELEAAIDSELPSYARPLFIRIRGAMPTTGTFKSKKNELVAAGLDPLATDDRLFFREPGAEFTPITPSVYARLQQGGYRL